MQTKKLYEMDKFNVAQLDKDGKAILDEFGKRFIELRRQKVVVDDRYYDMHVEFLITSCSAQTGVIQKALQYFGSESRADFEVASKMDHITNWNNREIELEAYIYGQLEKGNLLPKKEMLKYVYWPRVRARLKVLFFPFVLAWWALGFFPKKRKHVPTIDAPSITPSHSDTVSIDRLGPVTCIRADVQSAPVDAKDGPLDAPTFDEELDKLMSEMKKEREGKKNSEK